ncbi:MAG: PIN domain-containing protein [Candidatus Riflebacteria bacterium]|nr:PIN domain-containing protein [Candidatus Riflebacteria bacterium]
MAFVLDTSAVADLLRAGHKSCTRMQRALDEVEPVLLCPVVLYETERGLLAKPEATSKRARFVRLLQSLEYREMTDAAWLEASRLWVETRKAGRPHADADLLIAAFAKVHEASVVTHNTKDFEGLGVAVEDWSGA